MCVDRTEKDYKMQRMYGNLYHVISVLSTYGLKTFTFVLEDGFDLGKVLTGLRLLGFAE